MSKFKLLTLTLASILLLGCGGITLEQKVLRSINSQCKDNGGIYDVYISEGRNFHFGYYKINCKDGSNKVVLAGEIE